MVRVAEEVQAVELEVGFPVIVTQAPVEVFQHAHRLNRFTAASGMGEEQRPMMVTNAVEPVERLIDMDAGFIGVQKQLLDQFAYEKCFEWLQQSEGLLVEVEYRSGADLDSALIPEVVPDAVIRDQLLLGH